MQIGGEHYVKHGKLQPWDIIDHYNLDFYEGNILKYLLRWKDKGGINDLLKAQHFLARKIEWEEARTRNAKVEDEYTKTPWGLIPKEA